MIRGRVLAGSITGAVIVAFDGTVLTVAQPSLRADLGASLAQVQWVGTGYLVAVAGLLVFAGRLGDRYGHQRLFGIGMLGFGAASAGIAAAPDIGWMVGLRVVQGVFGALLQPATLGMLRAWYPPDALRRPIALRTAAIGVAAAVGPVVGGALVSGPGWRAVFLVNVIPAVVFGGLALGWGGGNGSGNGSRGGGLAGGAGGGPVEGRRVGPAESGGAASGKRAHSLDLPGALLLTLALGGLVLALLPGAHWTVAALVAVAGVAFVRHERRTPYPLVPGDVVRAPGVAAALALLVAASAALHGTLFVCVFLLQGPLGLDPFESAVRSLPLAVLMVGAAAGSPVVLRRLGARWTALVACGALTAGIVLLSQATGTFALCCGFALVGAGFGAVMVTATQVVVRHSPVASAGVAGGLQQTALHVGPVLGVAAVAALMSDVGLRAALVVPVVAGVVAGFAAWALPGGTSGGAGATGRAPGAVGTVARSG
ncbi:MFS transporter [Streptomyces sp. NPDC056716]|uniref:MFS transporter n=1 Tax=unclassified Streptomyces TaxID=2593676 RepID=UPI0036BF6E7A